MICEMLSGLSSFFWQFDPALGFADCQLRGKSARRTDPKKMTDRLELFFALA